ncbi:helix-turn-helix domain-containing protein [Paenibacillus sp. A3]|uniref:helix-turn-helix domain-containing protein n=1 Tax=Paenibacillus sp. A3 TaxID=1337054 RepID=UPI0009E81E14|nr:helix-turn-helix domain-containing protein [Paenibacillus sp. A3]
MDDIPGGRLRKIRQEKKLTVRDVSLMTGLTEATIMNIETGKTVPSLSSLRTLSEYLDIPIYYLGCFEDLPERTLGERMRKARMYHGFTKKEISELLEVDVKTLYNWESDACKPYSHYMQSINSILKKLER